MSTQAKIVVGKNLHVGIAAASISGQSIPARRGATGSCAVANAATAATE